MTSKISTNITAVSTSALDMYYLYAKGLIEKDPTLKLKNWTYVTNGEVVDKDGKSVINYRQFKDILSLYNKKAGEKIIKGYTLDLLNGMGNLFLARIQRPSNSGRIDYATSKKLKKKLEAEGKLTDTNWLVPYTDDDFIMLMWHKSNHKQPGMHIYKFKTAGGKPGSSFRSAIGTANKANPLLKVQYPYLPTKSI